MTFDQHEQQHDREREPQRDPKSALERQQERQRQDEPQPKPQHQHPDIWGIVLAAGASKRMGRQKLTLPLEDGTPMVRRVLDEAAASSLSEVVVVVRADDEDVQRATQPVTEPVTKPETQPEPETDTETEPETNPNPDTEPANRPWMQVRNWDAADGMSTSLRAGIATAEAGGADAVVILLADQPGITRFHINAVVEKYGATRDLIVQASYNGAPSHPTLFDRKLFRELLEVTGDEGGRSVVQRHQNDRCLVSLEGEVPVDLDTPESYKAWLQQSHSDGPGSRLGGTLKSPRR
ncbi:nucleotidyltransferase family protein [Alicyclobacillus curvatus]|nr:nucleotidyltransferase family protein [Alicyclobacillus curvatus]